MAKLTLVDIAAGYALIATINANNAAVEAALENTLSRDGTAPNTMSAELDMNSQQITNLIDPTSDAHAARKGYVDDLVAAITAASGTFSVAEAHDFTNQIDFSNTDGLRILDPALAASTKVSHDGVDLNFDPSTTTSHMHLKSGMNLQVWSDDNLNWGELQASNGNTFDVVSNTGTTITISPEGSPSMLFDNTNIEARDPLRIMLGKSLRLYDAADQDFLQISHDGTEIVVTSAGTGGGSEDIRFDNVVQFDGSIGFYATTPIAKQTGVAVTAGGIHAALVALGLIAA